MKTIRIEHDSKTGQLMVDPDPQRCSVKTDQQVEWKSKGKDIKDWCVVFGPQAPLHPKVATRDKPTLTLFDKRDEDLRHCKYVVVAWTGEKLKHEDPELIVET